MTVYALIIINKAGGLIYHRQFDEGGLNKLTTNDYLVLAGTFHGVHAITARLSPIVAQPSQPTPAPPGGGPGGTVGGAGAGTGGAGAGFPSRPEPPSGLEVLETENFRMQCFNTLTGTKFLVFTDINQTNSDVTTRRIYDLYTDYVMKNPFYQLEMPIRCELFEKKLQSYIKEINNR